MARPVEAVVCVAPHGDDGEAHDERAIGEAETLKNLSGHSLGHRRRGKAMRSSATPPRRFPIPDAPLPEKLSAPKKMPS